LTIVEEAVEINTPTGPMRSYVFRPSAGGQYPGVLLYSEIFQVTGPIRRTAGAMLPYDQAGADIGNAHKIGKEIAAYDSDSRAALDYLKTRTDCTGRFGVIGICIGGHLAFRAAMNPDVLAAACFYATDIHKGSLGKGMNDNSLARAGEIRGELLHIWGRQDPHVPLEGRIRIHARLEEVGAKFQWIEVNGQHAFLRDEGPRYDASLARLCFGFVHELFHRRLHAGDATNGGSANIGNH